MFEDRCSNEKIMLLKTCLFVYLLLLTYLFIYCLSDLFVCIHCFRLHKRYYYCHMETGAIQWEYPQCQNEVQQNTNQNPEGEAMELCTTPPHPSQSLSSSTSLTPTSVSINTVSEIRPQLTPPPPIISETAKLEEASVGK